jgi:soluble epoxide hydrolase / lipid-phosphate phosphatase
MQDGQATVGSRREFAGGVHRTSYLEAGPADGPLLVLVHGWPGIAWTWRHQLDHFAERGFHVVAPDLRGYGHSTVYADPSQYGQELVVRDMLALVDHLGVERAIWVGHDWGCPTIWNVAAHYPERCVAAAALAVPFGSLERGLDTLVATVDRQRYPRERFPFGQFDYMAFYESSSARVTQVFDANPGNSVKALFRRGDPTIHAGSVPRAAISEAGGWFGGADAAPDATLESTVLTADDYAELTESLTRNGFHGPSCYYLNHGANAAYATSAPRGGRLELPVLFVGADYDPVADLTNPSTLTAMRATCADLTVRTVGAGHWLHMEQPQRVNEIIQRWLEDRPL